MESITPNKEAHVLIDAYTLIKESRLFEFDSEVQWVNYMNHLHSKGWLYTSYAGARLMAVGGAFRIAEWSEEYRDRLPDAESGHILYIPFFVSRYKNTSHSLKLLRQFLASRDEVHEILFYRKNFKSPSANRELQRRYSFDPMRTDSRKRMSYRRNVGILPPGLVFAA